MYARPIEVADEDIAEILHDAIPQMVAEQLQRMNTGEVSQATGNTSPRQPHAKREASAEPDQDRSTVRVRTSEDQEALSCEALDPFENQTIEALTESFIQKKLQKEIPPTGHDPEVQAEVDKSKTVEWETLLGKQAVRVWSGKQAKRIIQSFSHRFIGSRFVIVRKVDEEGTRIKSRLCLQGHLDPDFEDKIQSGACHSPTLHAISRALVLQILASKGWLLQLGDIKGAFLEAGPLDKKYTPLYAKQPPGGVPGLHPDDVIEVVGNLYGANDAPLNWYHTYDTAVRQM